VVTGSFGLGTSLETAPTNVKWYRLHGTLEILYLQRHVLPNGYQNISSFPWKGRRISTCIGGYASLSTISQTSELQNRGAARKELSAIATLRTRGQPISTGGGSGGSGDCNLCVPSSGSSPSKLGVSISAGIKRTELRLVRCGVRMVMDDRDKLRGARADKNLDDVDRIPPSWKPQIAQP
jgi:hypothetical protein